jgi:hypothetical protein
MTPAMARAVRMTTIFFMPGWYPGVAYRRWAGAVPMSAGVARLG